MWIGAKHPALIGRSGKMCFIATYNVPGTHAGQSDETHRLMRIFVVNGRAYL